jgi:Immunoglobulin I-set domain
MRISFLTLAAGITMVAFQNCGQNFETLGNQDFSSTSLDTVEPVLGQSPEEYVSATGEIAYRIADEDRMSLRNRRAPVPETISRPRIFVELGNLTASEDQNLMVPAMITGEQLKYAWYKANVLIPNETTSVLRMRNLKKSDAGKYKVVATNDAGSVSNEFSLTVTDYVPRVKTPAQPGPRISKPEFVKVAPTQEINESMLNGNKRYIVWQRSHTGSWSSNGSIVAVYAEVGWSPIPARYQWFLNGRPIENATSADISFNMNAGSAVGNFYLEACNDVGCSRSETISVTKVGF